MTFWTWFFLLFLSVALTPFSWLVGHAVGMEKASWGRAWVFALLEAMVAGASMSLIPLNFFVIEVLAGVFAALFVSPLIFRILMTEENARALLGAFLLTVVGFGGTVLFLIF